LGELEKAVKELTEIYLQAHTDEVEFARKILDFNPCPYQEKFLKDRSRQVTVNIAVALLGRCCVLPL